MLLQFFLELISGGPELWTELLYLTENSLWNFLGMFNALRSFFDFEFIEKFYWTFLQNSPGGEQNSQQNCWIWKKIPPKFFGYV